MIAEARNAGSKVLLVGMQMPPNYGPAYTRRFTLAFTEVSKAAGVPLDCRAGAAGGVAAALDDLDTLLEFRAG